MTATLLVTRPRAQVDAWLERVRALGVNAEALPLIDILPAATPDAGWAAWAAVDDGADLAVFVSPNAVEQFFALAPRAAWPTRTLAACVGPGSAQALEAHGVPTEQIVQPAADAASLDSEHLWAELASRRNWVGARVVLLRGDGGREWLADRLSQAGAQVQAFGVYRRAAPSLTEAEQALLAAALAHPADMVWLFSSAEGVGNLGALVPPGASLAGHRAIATHPRIAQAAEAAGFAPVVLARPDPAAVTQAFLAL
jgi:uroporphyrinogen-III synthase